MSELNRVHEWNLVAGNKFEYDLDLMILYHDLIKEEYQEYMDSISEEDTLDALGDLYVVITGYLHGNKINAEELLKRINDSNFSKYDTTEEDAKKSVAAYENDNRYTNVHYEEVAGYYVIRGDKINGGKNKILKSHKYQSPHLKDLIQ